MDYERAQDAIHALNKKVTQVQEMYVTIWQERTIIYQKIITDVKIGRGFLFKKQVGLSSFGNEISRLRTLNFRELRIITILLEKDNFGSTIQIKDAIVKSFQTTLVSKTTIQEVVQLNKVATETTEIIGKYFKEIGETQKEFLEKEAIFVTQPTNNNLRNAYCAMQKFMAVVEQHKNSYAERVGSETTDIIAAIKNLDKILNHAETDPTLQKDSELQTKVRELREAIRPYNNKDNSRLIGDRFQRISFITTRQPEMLVAIALRCFGLGKYIFIPGVHAATHTFIPGIEVNYPEWFTAINIFLITYLTLHVDVLFGLAQYSVEYPKRMIQRIVNLGKTKYELDLTCPA